ncbi:MAG: hypothetical protein ABII06_10040 [Pseudomonadota bacterium]
MTGFSKDKADDQEMQKLLEALEKEARLQNRKKRKGVRKDAPRRNHSEDVKRIKELEINALERKQAIEAIRTERLKKKVPERECVDQAIEEVIGKYLKE